MWQQMLRLCKRLRELPRTAHLFPPVGHLACINSLLNLRRFKWHQHQIYDAFLKLFSGHVLIVKDLLHMVTWSTQRSTILCLELLLHWSKPRQPLQLPPPSLSPLPPLLSWKCSPGLMWTEGRAALSLDAKSWVHRRPANELLSWREPPEQMRVDPLGIKPLSNQSPTCRTAFLPTSSTLGGSNRSSCSCQFEGLQFVRRWNGSDRLWVSQCDLVETFLEAVIVVVFAWREQLFRPSCCRSVMIIPSWQTFHEDRYLCWVWASRSWGWRGGWTYIKSGLQRRKRWSRSRSRRWSRKEKVESRNRLFMCVYSASDQE